MRRVFLCFVFLITTQAAAFAQTLSSWTTWVNQRGSVMTLRPFGAGQLSGHYVNNAQGFACRGTRYPLSGQTMGNRIQFTVQWKNWYKDCNSTTVWRGRIAGNAIDSQWQLNYVDAHGRPAVMRGRDRFTRIP